MKHSKRRLAIIISLAAIITAAAGTAVLLALRPDIRFRISEKLGLGRSRAAVTEAESGDVSTEEVSPEEFLKRENVTFDQSLLLVNSSHTIGEDIVPDIAEYNNSGVDMNRCIMTGYKELADKVYEKFGTKLFIMSSYRTAEEQAELADEENSDTAAEKNASEHQTGLALDVYVTGFAGDGFLKSDAGMFVNRNCWEYGWIIRYPQGKQNITGIRFEPWHIRWVGFPHSEIIYKNSLTLEEYIDFLNEGEFYLFENYIITRQKISEQIAVPKDCESYTASYDNTGCIIITGKREN